MMMENKKREEEVQEEFRCKNCGSKLTYIRLKEKQRVCRSCSHVEEIKLHQ